MDELISSVWPKWKLLGLHLLVISRDIESVRNLFETFMDKEYVSGMDLQELSAGAKGIVHKWNNAECYDFLFACTVLESGFSVVADIYSTYEFSS